MHDSSMCERRKREVKAFLDQPTFPKGCQSWEQFLEGCRKEEGKPFSLILERCFGETMKSVERYYFFGVTHVNGNGSFGRQCFTPLDGITYTPFFFNLLDQVDLGLVASSSQESKIVSISFETNIFESSIVARALSQVDTILKYSENDLYVVTLLGYLGILRDALVGYSLQKFDHEVIRIKSKLGSMDCEKVITLGDENSLVLEMD